MTIISLRKHFHLQNHATLNWFTICQICLTHESLKLIKNSRKYRSSCATFYLLESSLLKIEGKQAGGVWQKYIFHWEFSLVTQRRNKELINKAMEVSISINIAQIFLLSVEPFFLLYPARVVFIYWTQYPRILQLCLIFDLQHYWSTFNILIRAEYFFTSTNTKAVAVDGPLLLIKSATNPRTVYYACIFFTWTVFKTRACCLTRPLII